MRVLNKVGNSDKRSQFVLVKSFPMRHYLEEFNDEEVLLAEEAQDDQSCFIPAETLKKLKHDVLLLLSLQLYPQPL